MPDISDFRLAAGNPADCAAGIKEKKIIGFMCSYTPEEIIHAAGLHPMRITGSSGPYEHSDAHLQSYCCPVVRGALESVLDGHLDYIEGMVFPHTCDSIQRLSDIWRINAKKGFFADVSLPVRLDFSVAGQYLEDVLRRFINDLETAFGKRITDEDLSRSIGIYNRIRSGLAELYRLRSNDPACLTTGEIFAITRGAGIMDREYLASRLEELVSGLGKKDDVLSGEKKPRVVVSGSVIDNPLVLDALEESGAVVITDDLCTGTRYFGGPAPDADDPVVSLVRRTIRRPQCPAKHVPGNSRAEHLLDLVRQSNAQGVIFLIMKFCDPHSFDYPYLRKELEKQNVPSMLYEIAEGLPSYGQLLTRFETFVETISEAQR